MKKVFLIIFSFFILNTVNATSCIQVIQPAINDSTKECREFPTPCDIPTWWTKTDSCDENIVDDEDNQIIEKEDLSKSKELKMNFEVKNFSNCEELNKTIIDYLKNNPNIYYNMYRWGGVMPMLEKATTNDVMSVDAWAVSESITPEATDFSQTNLQFSEVDESDIVKNNWKYIYYYSIKDNRVYIIEAFPANNMKIVKKINLPKYFSNVNLFLSWNKLTITATRYSEVDFTNYFYNRNVKTTVIVYDVTNPTSLKLDRYYKVDWEASESRVIGDYLYILSKNSLDFPSLYFNNKWIFDETTFTKDMNIDKILPEKTDLSYTNDTKNQVILKWKKYPYSLFNWDVSDCKNISVIMPDSETIKKSNFRPSLTTLSSINLKNSSEKVTTKLLFGDVSNILMSKTNLYITSSFYSNDTFRCGPNMRCIMPYYYSWENTLIHKFNIDKNNLKYSSSNMVSWSPLNQYSMDEGTDGTFRIITSSYYPERNTNLFILDSKMQKLSSITNIAPKEDFKSSRFMWDKLYLVTFEQIDPLFVIDLKDNKNPKILWELKIPGYSTYLHPLEEWYLLWLWFDTFTNKWWWTQNWWLKIDIYDVNDLKNPKQIHTLTLWDNWSNSEVLNNPRMFVFDKSKKILYLPATIYTKLDKNSEDYRYKDVFVWTKVVKVDIKSWLKELASITHLDTAWLEVKRLEECKKYTNTKEQKCVKLIFWEEYCPANNTYIPTYCYADSTLWEYLANQIWEFNDYFIKRNIYMDNIIYTLSDKKVLSNDILHDYKEVKMVDLK